MGVKASGSRSVVFGRSWPPVGGYPAVNDACLQRTELLRLKTPQAQNSESRNFTVQNPSGKKACAAE